MSEGKNRPNRDEALLKRAAQRRKDTLAELTTPGADEEMNRELNALLSTEADLAISEALAEQDPASKALAERREPNKRFGEIQRLLKQEEWQNLVDELKAINLNPDEDGDIADYPGEEGYLQLGAWLKELVRKNLN